MPHQNNLKILVFIGEGSEHIIEYLTKKGFPKVSLENMPSQIEHLSEAGQHRIITNEVPDLSLYEMLQNQFPGEIQLVAVASENKMHEDEFIKHADYFVDNDPTKIDELLQKLDFTL
ncbi:MAG: hypothetical protein WAV04_00400 [Candidatus Microsaccharimonas sp.]